MTIFEMLAQSGILTLLGMGVVYLFLIILVFFVGAMGKVIHTMETNKEASAVSGADPSSKAGSAAKSQVVAAVITAAVNEYRNKNS